ncbi:MAG: thiamine pyrophosphate-dependent enzyme [Candidatus Paceibacterota bacterium]
MQNEILKNKGERALLLGNEAIVRGALEAGVRFVSTYPGTPASEVGNIFYKFFRSKKLAKDVYFEFSVNEKIAMEAAAGASFCGLRSLVAMKNFGLNVASDFLYPLVYSGVKGGLVIVVADDPSCWSSAQSEDNSRGHVLKAHIPTLEPSTPQECKEFVKLAFALSEKYKIPVMVRETTRVALQSGIVALNEIKKGHAYRQAGGNKAKFVKNPRQFVTMPPRVLEMHRELLDKIEVIREKVSEKSSLNFTEGTPAKIGVIASGVGYLYAKEALKELNLKLPVLKIGFFYPLPEKKTKNFIKGLKQVFVIEELEPHIENEVERLAKEANPKLKINGKNLLPEVGEIKPEDVISAISKLSGRKPKFDFKKHQNDFKKIKFPERNPRFCPGCPYNFVFSTLKRIVPQNTIFGGEIGCYMLAHYPPYETQDYLYCMGSDISIAHGIEKAAKQKVIAFVGDSSFFHASIPALINAVFNKSNPLIVILDNGTTAMTGHQPNPGVVGLKIEEIVRACGVKNVKIVDPVKIKEFEDTIKVFIKNKELSVIIVRHPCLFIER